MNKMTTTSMPVDNRKSAALLRVVANLLIDGEGLVDEITIDANDERAHVIVKFLGGGFGPTGDLEAECATYIWRSAIPEWELQDADEVDLIFV